MLGFFYLLILQEHILKRKGFNSKPFAQPLNVEFGMCFLLTGWWRGGNLHVWPHPISPASMLELLAGAGLLPRLDVPGGSMTDAAAGPGSRFLGAHCPTWRPVLSTLGAGYAFWAIVDPLFFPPSPEVIAEPQEKRKSYDGQGLPYISYFMLEIIRTCITSCFCIVIPPHPLPPLHPLCFLLPSSSAFWRFPKWHSYWYHIPLKHTTAGQIASYSKAL